MVISIDHKDFIDTLTLSNACNLAKEAPKARIALMPRMYLVCVPNSMGFSDIFNRTNKITGRRSGSKRAWC